MSWEDLGDAVPDILFTNEARNEILCCRLIGIGLSEVPPLLSETLTSLTTLNLDANNLQHLPPQLCQLRSLTELSAVKNRLVRLPPEIGRLTNMTSLSLPNNDLEYLPEAINRMRCLRRLELERNKLKELPQMGNMPLEKVNLNANQLTSLATLFFAHH